MVFNEGNTATCLDNTGWGYADGHSSA